MTSVNRADLHLHTKLSVDPSVIGVRDILKQAQDYGVDTIAFTNLGNVCDFPEIMHRASQYGVSVVYGAEVCYRKAGEDVSFRASLLIKDQAGVAALYTILSSADPDGYIDRDTLYRHREHLLVGSCGTYGELFAAAQGETAQTVAAMYDYFELYPSEDPQVQRVYQTIVALGKTLGIPVAASANAHYLTADRAVCCDVVNVANGIPSCEGGRQMRTTEELLDHFAYLGQQDAAAVVLEHPYAIARRIQPVTPVMQNDCYPVLENARDRVRQTCEQTAHRLYGTPLPSFVQTRLRHELSCLQDDQTATAYLVAKHLADGLADDGATMMSRGAVGATLLAFLLGISRINPLPVHYRCSACGYAALSDAAADGFDLPAAACPVCGQPLCGDGHTIPFESFMGLTGDRRPSFDITVAADRVTPTVQRLTDLFGADRVVRAGFNRVILPLMAKEYVSYYEEKSGRSLDDATRTMVEDSLVGVWRGTGTHPGGYLILPGGYDRLQFTPLITTPSSALPVATTQMDFHALTLALYKQNVLGDVTLTKLERLERDTGVRVQDIPMNDPDVWAALADDDTDWLCYSDNAYAGELVRTLKPSCFADLVRMHGLLHGTRVWKDNGEHYHAAGVPWRALPATREDVMNDLLTVTDRATAYRYSEIIRRGRLQKAEDIDVNRRHLADVTRPLFDGYADYCAAVRYMFPKSHAVEYAIRTICLSWYKHHYPQCFQAVMAQPDAL